MFSRYQLYITDLGLSVWRWKKGTPKRVSHFVNDAEGLQAFDDFLAQHKPSAVKILADFVEETFLTETLPHVFGSARTGMLRRKLKQQFHSTDFRRALNQGREIQAISQESDRRRDDIYLLSAMNCSDLLEPWLDILAARLISVDVLTTPAYLTVSLLNAQKYKHECLIAVSQETAGIRQSYLENGYLKFSRLITVNQSDPDYIATLVSSELERMHNYLLSNRLLESNRRVQVLCICSGPVVDLLQEKNFSNIFDVDLLKIRQAAKMAGVNMPVSENVGETLFLSSLKRALPKNGYAMRKSDRHNLQMMQLRRLIYLIAIGIGIFGFSVATSSVFDILLTRAQFDPLEQSINRYQSGIAELRSRFPETEINPSIMRSVSVLQDNLEDYAPSITDVLIFISQAVAATPEVELESINWEVEERIDRNEVALYRSLNQTLPVDAYHFGASGVAPKQYLRLSGEINVRTSGYRPILDVLNRFVAELDRLPELEVTDVQEPLNLRSNLALDFEGGADSQRENTFEIQIELGEGEELFQ